MAARDPEQQIRNELEFHLEMSVQRLVDEGMPLEEARREARARFGDADLYRETCERDQRRWERQQRWQGVIAMIRPDGGTLWRSLVPTWTSAIRSLRRTPGLAIAAVLCLGIGAAATSAVATLFGALVLRPLPFPDADRLVRVWFQEPGVNPRVGLSIPEFEELKQIRAFDRFVGTARARMEALTENGAERLRGEGVSPEYFATFGVQPELGRLLQADDHASDSVPAVVLSHGGWTRLFGGDTAVLGNQLRASGSVYTIVGVAQAGFAGTIEDDVIDFFIPIEHYAPRSIATNRASRSAWAVARLAPGATIADANGEVAALRDELARRHPEIYQRYRSSVEPMGESWRQRFRGGAGMLFGASVLLLLIAAVNVGCLLLARVLDRRSELAVRASLGAGAARLMAQLFAEALLLVVCGGIVGVVAGPWLLEALLRLSPVALPPYVQIKPDSLTLLITIAVLGTAGLLAGIAPGLVGRRVQPGDVLRGFARGTTARMEERRWTTWLIAGETALTLVLLIGAGLLFRSFERLDSADLGFDRANVARLAVTLSASDVRERHLLPAFYDRLRTAISGQPGVDRVGLVATTLPPFDSDRARLRIPEIQSDAHAQGTRVSLHFSDHGLLPALGVPMVAGRNIAESDQLDAPRVGVISQSLARVMGGAEKVVGRTIEFFPTAGVLARAREPFRVIGVAEDVAWDGLVDQDSQRYINYGDGANVRAARYDVYLALAQTPSTVVSVAVTSTSEPDTLLTPLRKIIRELAPTSAVHWISTMEDEVALEYAASRFYSVILAIFSVSALLLTGIGLFALLSFAAAQRMSEMGLRIALGATPMSTGRLLLRAGLTPLAAGVVIGLGLAVMVSRLLAGMLFGVSAFDTLTFAAAVLIMLGVTLLAALIPARRVTTVDPIRSLRG